MNDRGVCRTAPALPCLLDLLIIKIFVSCVICNFWFLINLKAKSISVYLHLEISKTNTFVLVQNLQTIYDPSKSLYQLYLCPYFFKICKPKSVVIYLYSYSSKIDPILVHKEKWKLSLSIQSPSKRGFVRRCSSLADMEFVKGTTGMPV